MKSFLPSLSSAFAVLAMTSLAHADPSGCNDEGLCVAPPPPKPVVYEPSRPKPTPTRMRSIPVFVTGIVFDVIGGAATAAGVGLLVASPDCPKSASTVYAGYANVGCSMSSTLVDLAGIGALTGGAIFLAIGIPLTVSGARSVPDVDKASAVPVVRVGATGGSLTWKF